MDWESIRLGGKEVFERAGSTFWQCLVGAATSGKVSVNFQPHSLATHFGQFSKSGDWSREATVELSARALQLMSLNHGIY